MFRDTSGNNAGPLFPARLTVGLLMGFAILAVPLFVCAPVTSDTSLFDVQALTVLKGGILYRDVIEPNLPGIVWIHLGLRTVIGWSSEAIRCADLLIFGVIMFLLSQLVLSARDSLRHRSYPALFLLTGCLFYLTRNEWCHCQRDIWLLLPVGCALWLRTTRIEDATHNPWNAVVEGVFWGIAFWIKPHVAIPAIAVLAVDAVRLRSWKERGLDVGKVILGGVLAAIPGIVWLISTGAWAPFWDMMLNWNPEYLATGRNRGSWARMAMMLQRFQPWWLVHLAAVPLAFRTVASLIKRRDQEQSENSVRGIVAVCYLAWLGQTFTLQHAMDYIHVPEVLLALGVLAAHPWSLTIGVRRVAVATVLLISLMAAPQFHGGRVSTWSRCLEEGSTPEVRSMLAQGNYPDWNDLSRVQQFLSEQQVRDGDVACLNVHSIHLHQELKILPATRYWSISHPLTMYPSRYSEIMTAVEGSHQRFVVVEERETRHPGQILPQEFPGHLPLVFESGTYKVYAASERIPVATSRGSSGRGKSGH